MDNDKTPTHADASRGGSAVQADSIKIGRHVWVGKHAYRVNKIAGKTATISGPSGREYLFPLSSMFLIPLTDEEEVKLRLCEEYQRPLNRVHGGTQ